MHPKVAIHEAAWDERGTRRGGDERGETDPWRALVAKW